MNKCISFITAKIRMMRCPAKESSQAQSSLTAWAWFIGLWLASLVGFSLFVYGLKAIAKFLLP
ncbi:hypothetical protein CC99x_003145 [Candidatus Berkiella cookevillensis]|uniref:DUF2474 domain-containing protein n=1 Tax=Candidatus Berkiella cookevillensis TaxID=437022 RepID=A0A0Q9YDA1_9GAMM|nr:hypothetical protein [Candidatus Berkiella cookevillensis]MCS5707894.1 hypothetical protein [Candidatus Berkiella cookevillensis]